ncbi:MAG: hypothetical protein FWG71_05515 [Synergistaceae bacterium]|nr:hypothetical protein [Synergistaceae bacterium]
MLVKVIKKSLLVLVVVMLLAIVPAASANSPLVGGSLPSGGDFRREIKGGITVEFKGMSMSDGRLIAAYAVTSETDQVINIKDGGADLFDNEGTQLTPYGYYIYIGNHRTSSREIIGGVSTSVTVPYNVGDKYQVRETYARLTFIINGENLVFRNVPSRP